ncbi:TPA: hypothetical protein ACX6SJ_003858 [Photobacterium damselae]
MRATQWFWFKKGNKYQYAAQYDQRYLETVEVIDEQDRSLDKYRGTVTVTKLF